MKNEERDQNLNFDSSQFERRFQPIDQRGEVAAMMQQGMHIIETEERGLDMTYVRRILIERREVLPSKRHGDALERGERWAIFATADNLAVLPERQLEALLWYYWGELPADDVAGQMNISPGTVRRLLIEAKKNLENLENRQ